MIRTEPASSSVVGAFRPELSKLSESALSESAGRTSRWSLLGIVGGFVLLLMLQSPGRLAADTKMDVALEPWRFLERATHLWNSSSDFGFIPNQYAGYLFPMGPFFLTGKLLSVPPWITQRLWMALLLTVGAWGLVRLADVMGVGRPSTRVLAGVAYALSPMFLGKIGSASVALTGAAMLPWIVLPLVLGIRPAVSGTPTSPGDPGNPRPVRRTDRTDRAGVRPAVAPAEAQHVRLLSPRRAAALSGIAILCTGGVNASVTMCVLLLPAVLLALAGNTRRAWALRGWWFVAVVFATAWWILALLIQGKYGLNFLPYTETADTTTSTASVGEALRGTTDWLAYLRLPTPWVPAATDYVTVPTAIVGSGVVAAIGLWGLSRTDLPGRRFLVAGAAVGVVAVAAAYPGEPAGLFSNGVRELLATPFGFLRNVYKFQPVVRVPIALGLAHACAVALRRTSRVAASRRGARLAVARTRRLNTGLRWVVVGFTVAALVVGITPALSGRVMSTGSFKEVPDYWVEAADWLGQNPAGGRTLVLPGTSFGEYSWGRPLDEPLQWLSTTPWGVRSLIPLGGVGVTRLMDGIERQLALGSAPGLEVVLARAGIGQIVVRNDLQNKDWDIPPSTSQVERALESSNLTLAKTFGPAVDARIGAKDRLVEDVSKPREQVPSLEVWTVPTGVSEVESYPAETAMVVSGGSEATLQLAAQGVLDADRAVVLASDLSEIGGTGGTGGNTTGGTTPDGSDVVSVAPAPDSPPATAVIGPTTTWAATDTFDRRDFQFGLVHSASSYLLGPTESAAGASDPVGQWVDRPVGDHQTVAGYVDGMSVTASSYGFDLLESPDLGPYSAVDEASYTSWQARSDPNTGSEGAWLRLDVGRQVSVADIQVRLLAETVRRPVPGAIWVTTEAGSVLTQVNRNEDVQALRVPEGPTRWFELKLVNVGGEQADPVLGVGVREVAIPGVRFQRYAQVPGDVANLFAGPNSGAVVYSFDRERVDPSTPFGGDEERTMARRFEVPRDMDFTVNGAATFLLPADPNQLQPPQAPIATVCGVGPAINIDGVRYETRFRGGTLADVAALRPLPVELCTFGGTLRLTAGQHMISVEQGYQTLDSLVLADATPRPATPGPRSTQVTEWSQERRVVKVGAGERAFLAVRENSNPSWTASINGQRLVPIRLDGWQQGWIVPAGVGGAVVIENAPGTSYQRNLVVGGLLVLLLLVMLALPDRFKLRPRSDPDGVPAVFETLPLPFASGLGAVPGWFWPAAFGTLAVALVAGPLALAVPVLVFVALRWPWALPWTAFAAMVAACIGVAVEPNSIPGSGHGAFSWIVQTFGALSLAACLASVAFQARSTDDDELAPGRSGRLAARHPEAELDFDLDRRHSDRWNDERSNGTAVRAPIRSRLSRDDDDGAERTIPPSTPTSSRQARPKHDDLLSDLTQESP